MEKLLKERDEREKELIDLLKLTPNDIWNKDLDDFMNEWHVSILLSKLNCN